MNLSQVKIGFANDWVDISEDDLYLWSEEINKGLTQLSKQISDNSKDGYYWYLYGSMSSAASMISHRIILQAQNQLRKAQLSCKMNFLSDFKKVKECQDTLNYLINFPQRSPNSTKINNHEIKK